MPRFWLRVCKIVLFLHMFLHFKTFIFSNHNHDLIIELGETLSQVFHVFSSKELGTLHRQDGNLVLIKNLSSKINGLSPTQVLCSFDRENKLMVIGYFFSTLRDQENALSHIAPFSVPFKDGYGANYNEDYIINASPQSGSYLLSFIDRKLFQYFDQKSVDELIKTIDKNYFSVSRPKENISELILPGDTFVQIKNKIAKYDAEYEVLLSGDIRIYRFGKRVLSSWVNEGYVVLSKTDKKAMKVFYQFYEENEGVVFASSVTLIKNDPLQLKLLQSESKFAAKLYKDIFVLASPQGSYYRVVFIDIPVLKSSDLVGYNEVLRTLERTDEYLKSR